YIAILIAVFVGIPSYVYSKWKDDKILNSQNTVIEDSNQPVKAQAPMDTLPVKQTAEKEVKALDLEQQELSRIAMIIDSSTDCYSKNSYGDIVDITINECRALSSKNNRMSFSKVKKEQYLQENVSVNSNENIDYKPPTYPNL
ncbi:zonular occludens toxin, partial [Acinetobacter baumannii]|nr:zonular occludens toxin [Acinetobacter baumannii]